MADDYSTLRHYPCYLLQEKKIPCVVWLEDALRRYNVPTAVFNLHVLVEDIDAAAEVLIQKGWILAAKTHSKCDIGIININKAHRRLLPPRNSTEETQDTMPRTPTPTFPPLPPPLPNTKPAAPDTTILLPAAEWNYTLPQQVQDTFDRSVFYPPLPALVDAIIDSFLDTSSDAGWLWDHMGVQICYLYEYTPALKDRSFAEQLKYDHRQFHLDTLSGMCIGTLPFARHQLAIREALRLGNYQLRECSATRDNKALFD